MKISSIVGLLSLGLIAEASIQRLPHSQFKTLFRQQLPAAAEDTDPELLYPAYTLDVPVDHFHNDSQYAPHSDAKFALRYWFDAKFYKPGGPVFVLSAGETSGVGRLPFLQKGIVAQVAEATHGVGVILEHRYYGESWPVPDLSTKNLRFLTTDQALADTAYFAKNVVFKGLEKYDLTASKAPWIIYGGSYAGGFASFARKLYPDVFFGGISSSGVTYAIWDYWQYFEPIRKYAPQACVKVTQLVTNVADNIFFHNKKYINELKSTFGLANITYTDDFASVLAYGIYGWQGRNWDPDVGSPDFEEYCGNVTNPKVTYPATAGLEKSVRSLVKAGNHGAEADYLTPRILNWIGWLNTTTLAPCARRGRSQDQCFGTHNSTYYHLDDISQEWRAWPYQYCTQWGYLQTGSGAPRNILPLISRIVDLEYSTIVCREAFGIYKKADLNAINKYGGLGIRYPRLAQIGGETDPWRPASPLADNAPHRPSTLSEPRILIKDAVHHWEENGVFKNQTRPGFPPKPVVDAQRDIREFVKAWLKEWKPKGGYGGGH